MKKALLLLLLVSSFFADAQSLKDALFSGKLKNEPGSMIRKGDDLSTKIDTATRKDSTNDSAKLDTTALATDTTTIMTAAQKESPSIALTTKKDTLSLFTDTAALVKSDTTAMEPAAAPKDNNAIWKEYMTSLTGTIKAEVLSSKKVKNGSYYVLVSYSIGTDGQVTITDVFVSPENEFLQQQIKERIALETPKLNPVLNDAGTPRKVNKKYNFTLVKE